MKPFIGEVLPALLAMAIMGLAAMLLLVLFDALRSLWKKAFANPKAVRPVERPQIEAKPSNLVEDNEPAQETPTPELQFDGDASMFEGDFADTVDTTSFPQDILPEKAEPINDVGHVEEQIGEADLQAELLPFDQPKQIEVAQGRRDRKQHRGEREGKTDRRGRKAEKLQRDAAPDEARETRQQNRRKNKQ